MSPQMSRILQGVIVPKSDVLYFSTESKQQLQNVSCAKAKRQQKNVFCAKAKRQQKFLVR